MAIIGNTTFPKQNALPVTTSGDSANTNVSPASDAKSASFDATLDSIRAAQQVFKDACCLADANYVKFLSLVNLLPKR
jgi:hypothetical protein